MHKSLKAINTILWDLDGTLIDSEYIHDEAVVYACDVMCMDLDTAALSPGQDAVTVFELIIGGPLNAKNMPIFNKWHKIAIQYTIDNFYKARQIPQSIELVHEFARLGLAQSIVSNTTSGIIHQCIDNSEIAYYISNFIGRDNVSFGKPSPEPYLHAMRLHKVEPENCLVFEDSYTGIQAAIKAGIKVIAIGDHARDFPMEIDHICSLDEKSWLIAIKEKYFI